MIVLIDDILVYLRSREKHAQYLRILLQTLTDHVFFFKFSKCELCLESVTFFGHVVSKDGIMVDPSKIEAIGDWSRPISPTKVCIFIGFTNYYRQFIEYFATILASMTKLTWKEIPFQLSKECELRFGKLKDFLTLTPILNLPIDGE